MGDFNSSLISIDRSSRQKINKETQALNDTLDQMDLTEIDIYIYIYTHTHTYIYMCVYIYIIISPESSRLHILLKCI